jgi:hypothetical protein
MDMRSSRYCLGIALVLLIAAGCQRHNSVLSSANYKQKFDEVEATNSARPGDLVSRDIEAIVGPGESIQAGDPDLANAPPGVTPSDMAWSRWAIQNEVLLVGYANGYVASVVRLRR